MNSITTETELTQILRNVLGETGEHILLPSIIIYIDGNR